MSPKFCTLEQREMVLDSFVKYTTLQEARDCTGLSREIVHQILRAAEYRGELRRMKQGTKTIYVRRCLE